MAADTGLIKSFDRLADANKRDYSGVLKAQKDQTSFVTKATSELTKSVIEKNEAQYKERNKETKLNSQKQITAFDEEFKGYATALDDGAGLPQKFADEIKKKMRMTKEGFDENNPTTGDDTDEMKDERAAYMAEVQGYEKLIQSVRTQFSTVQKTSEANKPGTLEGITRFMNIDDDENSSLEIRDDGVYIKYTVPGSDVEGQETEDEVIEKSLDEMLKEYVPEAVESETLISGVLNDLEEIGEGHGFDLPPTLLRKKVDAINTELSKDPKILADISQRKMSGFIPAEDDKSTGKWTPGSIAHSFQSDPSLNIDVYKAAGIKVDTGDGKGGEPDGIVSEEEARIAMSGENKDIIISTIVDPFYINPITKENNFNHVLSATLISNRIGQEGTRRHKKGKEYYTNEQRRVNNTAATKDMTEEESLAYYRNKSKTL